MNSIFKKINKLDDMEIDKQTKYIQRREGIAQFSTFLSIRRLLVIIDVSISRPFFVRDKNGNLEGQSESVEWHNEYNVAMMILSYFKVENKLNDAINRKMANDEM